MNKKLPTSNSLRSKLPPLRRAALMLLSFFMVLIAAAQVFTYEKFILVSGQVTNSLTGAPIADHQVFITADSSLNNGLTYYATAKTDVNGFFRDTIVTTSNDGIITLYLYDFNNIQVSLDRYYRFIWDDEYEMIADLSIFDPYSTTDFQANFNAVNDPLEDNPLKVVFRDKSIGQTIKSWEWDFGDGQISQIQDPEHTYDKPGMYMVTLTISSMPPQFEHFMVSKIIKQVQVGYGAHFHMGGHVFANQFPIDFGLAYLYTFDHNENLVPVDTAEIDTLGYYYFYQLPVGKYLTKARLQPASVIYGQFMPTYLGNVFDWQQSQNIYLEGNNWECDISLLRSIGMTAGKGQIIGQITYDTNRTVSSIIPAGNIEILLLNEQGFNLTCGLSDMEGYFLFSDLAFGTYQLFPDVAGVHTQPMFVTITEDKPVASDVSLVILPGEITFSVNDPASDYIAQALQVFPNPAKDRVKVSFTMKKSSTLTLMVADLQGRTVRREVNALSEGPGEVVLDLGGLPAGFYQVILLPEDHQAVSGKILKFN